MARISRHGSPVVVARLRLRERSPRGRAPAVCNSSLPSAGEGAAVVIRLGMPQSFPMPSGGGGPPSVPGLGMPATPVSSGGGGPPGVQGLAIRPSNGPVPCAWGLRSAVAVVRICDVACAVTSGRIAGLHDARSAVRTCTCKAKTPRHPGHWMWCNWPAIVVLIKTGRVLWATAGCDTRACL